MLKTVLGVFAQVDAGKTTLSEALLFAAGQLRQQGRVDHGSAFLDHYELERSRGITIFSKQARFPAGKRPFILLDTPGHVDFAPEAERVMPVLDYALLLISGTDGVQPHTETLWRLLRRYRVPTLLFFNKMDLPGAERERLLAQVRQCFSTQCAELTDTESVALCNEAALEEYLATGSLSDNVLADMIKKGQFFPCFFGSALKGEGISALLDALERFTRPNSYPDAFSAKVYKIARDTQGNRLSFLKVTGGRLRVRDSLHYTAPDGTLCTEKATQLRLYSGAGFVPAEEVSAGDICAVLGPSALQAGDCLGDGAVRTAPALSPVMTYRIELPPEVDPQTALTRLRLLEEEEPQLHLVWQERLREIHVQLMGQVHIEVLQSLILERFGWAVQINGGQVAYRETVTNCVEGVGHFEPLRHYAEVHLLLEPLPRDSGLVFAANCSEDVLDRNWQRLILTHLEEKTHLGVLTGSPITDMKITLAAGRAHLKHTEGGDFRQATYRAVRQGLMQAKSLLLEPFYRFRLTLPPSQLGRAMGDIRAMGGRMDSPQESGGMMVLEGNAPVSEMQDYMAQVVAYTHGQGRLTCTLSGYEPCHNAAQVLERMAYEPERDTENPADSVFCSHGAGVNIPWDQVFAHMHLEPVLRAEKAPQEAPAPRLRRQNLDMDEKVLRQIMEREFGPEQRRLYRPAEPTVPERTEFPESKPKYLIVDGYNMIFAWDGLKELAQTDLSAARERLLDILSNYCGFSPCELVVVFDSYRVKGGTGSRSRRDALRVVYTKENESADLYIESLVEQIGRNYTVRVATSDALIQLSALRSGVLRISARELLREIESTDEKIARYIEELRRRSRQGDIAANPLRNL